VEVKEGITDEDGEERWEDSRDAYDDDVEAEALIKWSWRRTPVVHNIRRDRKTFRDVMPLDVFGEWDDKGENIGRKREMQSFLFLKAISLSFRGTRRILQFLSFSVLVVFKWETCLVMYTSWCTWKYSTWHLRDNDSIECVSESSCSFSLHLGRYFFKPLPWSMLLDYYAMESFTAITKEFHMTVEQFRWICRHHIWFIRKSIIPTSKSDNIRIRISRTFWDETAISFWDFLNSYSCSFAENVWFWDANHAMVIFQRVSNIAISRDWQKVKWEVIFQEGESLLFYRRKRFQFQEVCLR
jgi:hypothetical protein